MRQIFAIALLSGLAMADKKEKDDEDFVKFASKHGKTIKTKRSSPAARPTGRSLNGRSQP
jgi:hypothetical protein